MNEETPTERQEADAAAAEAARIGGRVSDAQTPADEPGDEAQRPLVEAGQGEGEGFELAERELRERAEES